MTCHVYDPTQDTLDDLIPDPEEEIEEDLEPVTDRELVSAVGHI